MAKTTEELIAVAETKAAKTEMKRCIETVKESFTTAIEAQEDKGTIKILKALQKDVLAAIKG